MSDIRDERYTPPEIFDAINLAFDTDPCWSTNKFCKVPFFPRSFGRATKHRERGLQKKWVGRVWLNPPWTGRHAQVPWLNRFIQHGCGLGIVLAYTSSDWFQKLMPQMDAILFPKGKTRYILGSGKRDGSPPMGSVLFSIGDAETEALRRSGLGIFCPMKGPRR